jgi:RNA polymerase sigma-70 factor (ECF subfamily)
MHTTPPSLLKRLRQPGEEEAWTRFVQLYTPLLYFWSLRLGLQDPDAADLVQEVLTLLVQKIPKFKYDDRKSFRNWLRTMLMNKWRERQRGAAGRVPQPLPEEIAVPDEVDAFTEAEFNRQLALRALQLMQAEFHPTTWKACWEHVVGNRPAAEVAKELHISVNAVYLAKGRVLRRLRKEMDGLLP